MSADVPCPACRASPGVGRTVGTLAIACDWCDGSKTLPAMLAAAYRPASPVRVVDFVGRMSEAWDLLGRHPLAAGGSEHRALLALAWLPEKLADNRWNDLFPEQRLRLIQAARRAVDFGRACAWVFGEGHGA